MDIHPPACACMLELRFELRIECQSNCALNVSCAARGCLQFARRAWHLQYRRIPNPRRLPNRLQGVRWGAWCGRSRCRNSSRRLGNSGRSPSRCVRGAWDASEISWPWFACMRGGAGLGPALLQGQRTAQGRRPSLIWRKAPRILANRMFSSPDLHDGVFSCYKHASFGAPVAQLDRVPGYEPGGRRFESCRARHLILNTRYQRCRGSAERQKAIQKAA